MTQVDAERSQDQQEILRNVLHFIATTPDVEASLSHILQLTQTQSGVTGAGLFLYSDPRVLMTVGTTEPLALSDEDARALGAGLSSSLQIQPDLPEGIHLSMAAWAAAAVRIQKQTVGIFWLVLESTRSMDLGILQALVDAVTVVTMKARSEARHEKLGRNQSEFMRIVSHDLRSPLTSIQGFASMLEQGTVGEINERQAHFVEKILSGVTQMTSLVDNIQDAGRYDPETGFYEMERNQCDLAEIVSRIIKNHLVPAEKQELSLSAVISDDVPIIYADSNMLERAIINLVDNAIKYTPNGGQVEVGVRRRGDEVIISVRDSGLGISPDNQKNLFERHFRIPRREHKKIKGSGLGLFIVRSVAQRHGGNAWVESTEGQGSTFFFSIPLNEENAIVPDAARQ
ncbi:MAG: HAMP domain-containing sensor histidine kinase [bacterium]|nr:HAMP domain-containing sensor histidine kinase [bacterium]